PGLANPLGRGRERRRHPSPAAGNHRRSAMSKSVAQPIPANDYRFSRFRLIGWWDQEKLRSARVLVIGAGALGNEILKNMELLGFANIVVVDLDSIEASNLSRSILSPASDVGRRKADVAADAVRNIFPEARVHAITANVVHGLGLGLFA